MTAYDPNDRCCRCDCRIARGYSYCPPCDAAVTAERQGVVDPVTMRQGYETWRDQVWRFGPDLQQLDAGTLGLTDVRRDRDGRYGG